MSIIRMLVLLNLLSFSTSLLAEEDDGMKLLKRCSDAIEATIDSTAEQFMNTAYCKALIRGVRDTNSVYMAFFPRNDGDVPAYKIAFCSPLEATIGQLARVVVKFLDANPEKLHHRDSLLVIQALHHAYPCLEQ